MRLIDEGTIDRVGVLGLAERLYVSERHLTRVLTEHLGAGPLALARAQRASTARTLIETTQMPFGEIAFAAGFASIRQFNETLREVYASSPTELRTSTPKALRPDRTGGTDRSESILAPTVTLRLTTRQPFDDTALFGFLSTRSLPLVEQTDHGLDGFLYARSLMLESGPAVLAVRSHEQGCLQLRVTLSSLNDLTTVVARVRRLFDLDTDSNTVAELLSVDPILRDVVNRYPGRRAPGAIEANELAIRAVLGQQVSVAAARTLAARLSAKVGRELPREMVHVDLTGVTHLFPTMSELAGLAPEDIGIPTARARALIGLASALDDGTVDLSIGADRDQARSSLMALRGIGRWTAGYITMRALSDPDVLLDDDLAVLNGAKALGIAHTSKDLAMWGKQFSPFRSYVTQLLWASCPLPQHKRKESVNV